MIGVFDSGLGGLTVLRALATRFPNLSFLYLGDHANVPYGNRDAVEVLRLTQASVEHLFRAGCKLVILGCNTATAVAARHLQQQWLPKTDWRARGHNVLGIIAPTVEAATQTPWAVTSPQYPQKYNSDVVVVFGTTRTITSGVYLEEISKRCPRVRVVQHVCADLVDAIERRAGRDVCDAVVKRACDDAMRQVAADVGSARGPDKAILGCTHFPLVEDLFAAHLPSTTRILSQPEVVSDSLEDYLGRHAEFAQPTGQRDVRLTTTGDPAAVAALASILWPDAPRFEAHRQAS